MEIEKFKVLIQCLLIFRRSGDALFFVYARGFRGYTATLPLFCERTFPWSIFFSVFDTLCSSMIVRGRALIGCAWGRSSGWSGGSGSAEKLWRRHLVRLVWQTVAEATFSVQHIIFFVRRLIKRSRKANKIPRGDWSWGWGWVMTWRERNAMLGERNFTWSACWSTNHEASSWKVYPSLSPGEHSEAVPAVVAWWRIKSTLELPAMLDTVELLKRLSGAFEEEKVWIKASICVAPTEMASNREGSGCALKVESNSWWSLVKSGSAN